MDGWMDGWMDGQTDIRMDGQTDKYLLFNAKSTKEIISGQINDDDDGEDDDDDANTQHDHRTCRGDKKNAEYDIRIKKENYQMYLV